MTANRIIGIGGATVIVLLISFTWWNRSKDAPSRKSIQPSRGAEQVLATASAPVHKRSGKPTGTTEDNRPGKAAFIGAATLQAPPTANPPFSVRIEGTRPNARQVDQLARSVDAGDSYPTPNGLRKLYRLQGGVVVQIAEGADEQTTVDQLTAPGAALDGCEIEAELDPRLVVLRRADTDEVRKADPSPANTDEQRLTSARAAVGVASANPLFVEPESGLLLVPTSEV